MTDELAEPTPIKLGLPQQRRRPRRAAQAADAAAIEYQPDAEALALARRIVDLAEDKKASDIVLLEIGRLTSMADYFVICTGRSDRQLQALASGIMDALRDDGIRPLGVEGKGAARWVLLDYGAVIVHLFAPEEREFYGLERLWSNATQVVRLV